MRKFIMFSFFMIAAIGLQAQISNYFSQDYLYEDAYGHQYKRSSSLYQDTDNDGYINYYDRHDKNPNVGNFNSIYGSDTPLYNSSSYYRNYRSSSYDFSTGRTIYTGPRGGKYYINSNGNKTYVDDGLF